MTNEQRDLSEVIKKVSLSRRELFNNLLHLGQQDPIIHACLTYHFQDGLSQDDTLWLMIQTLHQDRERLLRVLQDCKANQPLRLILPDD